MNQQELIEEINNIKNKIDNIENDSPELESFFGYLPNDIKERKQYILKFNKTLRDEKRKIKELKCKKINNKNSKLEKKKNNKENNGILKVYKGKNLEKKIQQLNRKKQALSTKSQLIDSKINFLKEIKEGNKTNTPIENPN
ncbi:hypothetical protein ACTA71_005272 [Dictyostelium dimigraforme]